jgi:3-deoxy-manno-octulosonate cytidylyltransferase (CMP-KDO synthetase)
MAASLNASRPARPVNPIILIPARLQSARLPNKPLADIAGVPMIVQVMRRAEEAALGRVVVACGEPEIADAVTAAGGEAVLTRPDHASGSDRIYEALMRLDAGGAHDAVINIQGDLPTLAPGLPRAALDLLRVPEVDIGTLAAEIIDPNERDDPNVVKAVVSPGTGAANTESGTGAANTESGTGAANTESGTGAANTESGTGAANTESGTGADNTVPGTDADNTEPGGAGAGGRALYFTRACAPSGDGVLYHHIGLYAYRRAALERFAALPPSPLEQRERLEQLRALEAGMRIDVAFVDSIPLGVDTPRDLARARALLGAGA